MRTTPTRFAKKKRPILIGQDGILTPSSTGSASESILPWYSAKIPGADGMRGALGLAPKLSGPSTNPLAIGSNLKTTPASSFVNTNFTPTVKGLGAPPAGATPPKGGLSPGASGAIGAGMSMAAGLIGGMGKPPKLANEQGQELATGAAKDYNRQVASGQRRQNNIAQASQGVGAALSVVPGVGTVIGGAVALAGTLASKLFGNKKAIERAKERLAIMKTTNKVNKTANQGALNRDMIPTYQAPAYGMVARKGGKMKYTTKYSKPC